MSRPRLLWFAPVILAAAVAAGFFALALRPARASRIWVEGETPSSSTMNRHPWWYDKVKRDQLSGGDFISNWHETKAGEAGYDVDAPKAGAYDLWVRGNPIQSRLSAKVNDGPWADVAFGASPEGNVNIAEDGKPDLRFLAWAEPVKVTLRKGANTVRFRMDSANSKHGYLDCFVLTDEPFRPSTALAERSRPAAGAAQPADDEGAWFAFDPGPPERSASLLDLRGLNEKVAGEGGPIGVKGGRFVRADTGEPVRFWAVNGPPGQDHASLRREAKVLARYGVNLVRIHHAYYDAKGALDTKAVLNAIDAVEALKAEGIYTHLSVYFPVWLAPGSGHRALAGYDGDKHPFAALFFNDDFRKLYRSWWEKLLTTPSPTTGKRLVDDPAVFGLEVQNEDSLFFWTFTKDNLPEPQLRLFEAKFGAWLAKKYGSIPAAIKAWGGAGDPRDKPAEGRAGFRPLWNIANERTPRDKDTARFLTETQRSFYADEIAFLRGLGFKGVVTCSNWATADPAVLGPLEKYSYTLGDFVDRHGYYAGVQEGPDSAWKLGENQSYSDADALRFDPPEPGKPARFENPVMDPSYDGKPSMISETTFSRPNRYRSEAPLYLASYASLQGSDAVVHFTFDGAGWSTKPSFHAQPWTLMTPAMVGQFPAAAVLYRKGLVGEGDLLVDLNLKVDDLFALKGTPLPQGAALDELRLKDVPKGLTLKPGNVIDPLVHYAGRTNVSFSSGGAAPKLKDLRPFIDHGKKTVSSTNGHLWLDYGKGVLAIRAPSAQGVSGALNKAGAADLGDVKVTSAMPLGHVVAVSLDDRPLASSAKILLQVMSEEKPSGFRTDAAPKAGFKTIRAIGQDPWMVRKFDGTVRFKRSDASSLTVTALDGNGAKIKEYGHADEIRLAPTTLYYLIEAGPPEKAE